MSDARRAKHAASLAGAAAADRVRRPGGVAVRAALRGRRFAHPSALIARARRPSIFPGSAARRPCRRRSAPGPRHAGQHLRLVVRAVPRGTRIPHGARRRCRLEGQGRRPGRRRAEGFAGEHPALSGRRGDPYAKVGSTATAAPASIGASTAFPKPSSSRRRRHRFKLVGRSTPLRWKASSSRKSPRR